MKVTNKTRALAHEIIAYWLRFNQHEQSDWVASDEPLITTKKVGKNEVNVCNTPMCAAGAAVFLTSSPKKFVKYAKEYFGDDWFWSERAAELLGLDDDEAYRVFHANNATAKQFMHAIADGDKEKFRQIMDFEYESI